MTKRMLIDATHAEETRVVVLDGNRLEDFDVETAAKKQLKGNIYLAKVVRVEPSLQAAFVEYGGGRHGFLAFGEIHPDYYQIPVADRQRLMELQEAEARAEEEADDAAAAADEAAENAAQATQDVAPRGIHSEAVIPGHAEAQHDLVESDVVLDDSAPDALTEANAEISEGGPVDPNQPESPIDAPVAESAAPSVTSDAAPLGLHSEAAIPGHAEPEHVLTEPVDPPYGQQTEIAAAIEAEAPPHDGTQEPTSEAEASPPAAAPAREAESGEAQPDEPTPPRAQAAEIAQDVILGEVESYADAIEADLALGADSVPEAMEPATADGEFAPQSEQAGSLDEEQREDEPRESRAPARFMRSYKIQEVIRRRQILLIQVVKEERGSKGAALTTYISLAGRFSVLMPNSPRGGGISRKITSTADRRRLKEVTAELQIPRGMGLIVRTAGANRPKAEIKRDCEYLLELWDSIRETTMKSIAPALIHEEANLIKRAIRDNYSRDVDEVLVDGESGWRAARDFMRMLMPAHARKVVLWNNPQPLFAHQAVEAQLDSMLVPTVQLRSGGYLVINQTEALVAIDVNSGRSTRERGIEETALKTNLEAADEVARQLRLRDLAGLIVIDFIDMESRRNNTAVEKRMKDALKDDRARIQLGSISSFGLFEMSRQRLRPSLAETSFAPCPHCGGTGHVRSTETSALAVLRVIEEEGAKRRAAEICVYVAGPIALYVLNHKRVRLAEIEARYGMSVSFAADDSLLPPQTRIERLRAQMPGEAPPEPVAIPIRDTSPIDAEDDLVIEEEDETEEDAPFAAQTAPAAPSGETAAEGDARKRRRRRRGGRREDGASDSSGASEPSLPLAEPDASLTPAVDPALADQPELPPLPIDADAASLAAAADDARGRRRGRRGGRRRRRDENGAEGSLPLGDVSEEADGTDEPASFDAPRPSYTGPTPADPFGGGVFDIYDVMEQAEARAAAPPPPPPVVTPEPPEAEAATPEATAPAASDASSPSAPDADVTPDAIEPAEAAPVETSSVDEPVAPEPVAEAPAPEPEAVPAPEPMSEPVLQAVPLEHAAQEVLPEPEPVPAPPPTAERSEPVVGPVSAPVIIGSDNAENVEKKRGWWRR